MKEKLKEFEGALLAIIVSFIIFIVAAIISHIYFEDEIIRMVMTTAMSYFAMQVMCERG